MDQTRNLFISLTCVLLGFGTLMVHSASITSWPTEFEEIYLSRHVTFLALGVAAAALAACVPARFWHRAAPFLFTACVVLLVLVLVPGVGTRVNGAQRWLRLGAWSLQPSELAKLALPLLICRLICNRHGRSRIPKNSGARVAGTLRVPSAKAVAKPQMVESPGSPEWTNSCEFGYGSDPNSGGFVSTSGTLPLLLPVAVVVPLVLLQPDLGTSIFLAAGVAIALFVGGWPMRNFIAAAGLGVPALVYLIALKPYQMKRITGFLEAWSDLNQAPYQLKQSLLSLGAGGVWGVGIGKGWQKLSFLPEANTDFVFAVVGEELGLVGTLSLVALWVGLYVTGLKLLAPLPRHSFAYLAGFTLLTQLALQAALSIAVVTALLPPKGIPHPLLSYGGSNLVVSLVTLGVVVSLSNGQLSVVSGQWSVERRRAVH